MDIGSSVQADRRGVTLGCVLQLERWAIVALGATALYFYCERVFNNR